MVKTFVEPLFKALKYRSAGQPFAVYTSACLPPQNAFFSIFVTLAGIVMFFTPFAENAIDSMLVTLSGITMLVRLWQ